MTRKPNRSAYGIESPEEIMNGHFPSSANTSVEKTSDRPGRAIIATGLVILLVGLGLGSWFSETSKVGRIDNKARAIITESESAKSYAQRRKVREEAIAHTNQYHNYFIGRPSGIDPSLGLYSRVKAIAQAPLMQEERTIVTPQSYRTVLPYFPRDSGSRINSAQD